MRPALHPAQDLLARLCRNGPACWQAANNFFSALFAVLNHRIAHFEQDFQAASLLSWSTLACRAASSAVMTVRPLGVSK